MFMNLSALYQLLRTGVEVVFTYWPKSVKCGKGYLSRIPKWLAAFTSIQILS